MKLQNPILRGFNPDPSIVRVGADYYIATSTFEWFPGVQIHHSRDMANWRLCARPLSRPSQLDLTGVPDSCGVWAPCLTYADGQFFLIYTVVRRYGRTSVAGASGASLRDFHNYLVTSPTIEGDWSEPAYLNSSGFDPSLFHDDDGRKFLVNMQWDHRPGANRFAGIVLQEFDFTKRALVGPRRVIFKGTSLGLTEAPHLYKRAGWYYLMTAEGGTGWGHAVTLARSRHLEGPYELHPEGPVLTARDRPDSALQRAGHADLVETADGRTFAVYLCGRPLRNRGRCVLGRETAIEEMRWGEDGWLRTASGDTAPRADVEIGNLVGRAPDAVETTTFNTPHLPAAFQWLRTPWPDTLFSLTANPGALRLFGRESIGSLFYQALVARRWEAFCFSASTTMTFDPQTYQQAAGLVCYYNASKFHYIYVTHHEAHGRCVQVMSAIPDQAMSDAFTQPQPIADGIVTLRVEVDEERLRFAYRIDEGDWIWLPEIFDASILSDEAAAPGTANFTGAFVGMACQDTAGAGGYADFAAFTYLERPYCVDPTKR